MANKKRTSRGKARSQDRRNEVGWYRPLAIAIAIGAVAFAGYFILKPTLMGVDMRIETAMTGILVTHDKALTMPAEDIMIMYNTVTSVETLPSRPELKKVNGLDGLKNLIGKFQGSMGEVQVYARDYRNPATVFVLLKTTTANYILTPENPVAFVGIVTSRIGK
jgi:hypothetical protein